MSTPTTETRAALKAFFETGDKPTEAQLALMLDGLLVLNDDSANFAQASPVEITNSKLGEMYGETIDASNIVNFLSKFFFPFDPAIITLITSLVTLFEKGYSYQPVIQGTIYKKSETAMSHGRIVMPHGSETIVEIINFSDPLTDTAFDYTASAIVDSQTYKVKVDVNNDGSPTTLESEIIYATAVLPFYYGQYGSVLTQATILAAIGSGITKDALSSTKTTWSVTFDATQEYLHAVIPFAQGLPTEILDNNGYPLTFGPDIGTPTEDWIYNLVTITNGAYWSEQYYILHSRNETTVQGSFTFNF